MKDEPEQVASAGAGHVRDWEGWNWSNVREALFADRSGRLIVFDASSLKEARGAVTRSSLEICSTPTRSRSGHGVVAWRLNTDA
jgi:hypothetical protein